MTTLVTGAVGFIGSHLCATLLAKGSSVIAVDNLSSGCVENVAAIQHNSNFEFHIADVNDLDKMRFILKGKDVETVYHLASNTNVCKGEESHKFDYENTFESTLSVLTLMKEFSIPKLFFASSSCIYGEPDTPITENNITARPISYYGASKLASEAFISAFAEKHGIQVWIARLANVVGDRMVHGVIHDFVKRLQVNPNELVVLGSGETRKPFVYISDVIDAITLMVQKATDKYNVFVVGNDTETSIQHIAEMVVSEMKLNATITHAKQGKSWLGDVEKYSCTNDKIKQIGWKASYTSDEAVLKTIRDFINPIS